MFHVKHRPFFIPPQSGRIELRAAIGEFGSTVDFADDRRRISSPRLLRFFHSAGVIESGKGKTRIAAGNTPFGVNPSERKGLAPDGKHTERPAIFRLGGAGTAANTIKCPAPWAWAESYSRDAEKNHEEGSFPIFQMRSGCWAWKNITAEERDSTDRRSLSEVFHVKHRRTGFAGLWIFCG